MRRPAGMPWFAKMMVRPGLAGLPGLLLLASACGGDDGPTVTKAPTSPATAGATTPSPASSPTAPSSSPSPSASASPSTSPSAVRGGTYVVKSGDTLFDLATLWGVTVDAIVAANALADPDTLAIGQELKIP